MNTRLLKYDLLQDLGYAVVHQAIYKGEKIKRQRGKDKYGPVNNATYEWKGIHFDKVSTIVEMIDNQAKK